MSWHVAFNKALQFIELTYAGAVDGKELGASAAACVALIERHQTSRVLGDCSALDGGHTLADLYFLSDWVAGLKLPRFREAMLLPPAAASSEAVRFWQTTCINRGLSVKVFDNRETALEWLLT